IRRMELFPKRKYAKGGFDRSRGSQRMSHHGLGRTDMHIAKKLRYSRTLGCVIEDGSGSMCIHIVDLAGIYSRGLKSALHREFRTDSRRMWLCEMESIGCRSVADNLCDCGGCPRRGRLFGLQHEERSAFPQNHTRSLFVKGPNFFRSRRLQRIKA